MVLGMQQYLSFRDEMRERGLEPSSRLVSIQEIDRGRHIFDLDFEDAREKVIWVRTLRLGQLAPGAPVRPLFPGAALPILVR